MQTVSGMFTTESRKNVRAIAQNLQVSWHKQVTIGGHTFTIGASTIGSSHVIGANQNTIGTPGVYKYFDESAYVISMAWERGLSLPLGGVSKSMAEALLNNTNGRFLPNYMGGRSELSTAILPRRPTIINAGFSIDGVDITVPQFSGLLNKKPLIDRRTGQVQLSMTDYLEFFENRFLDETVMFTGQRSDQIMEYYLQNKLGLATADYVLDQGIQNIPFVIAPAGTKFVNLFNDLLQAEMGNFYQDESGKFRFENRQHWDNSPYNSVVASIYTAEVFESFTEHDDNVINVVEIKANPRAKQSSGVIYTQSGNIELSLGNNDVFINFENPVLAASNPVFVANTRPDGSGSNVTSSVLLKSVSVWAQTAQYVFNNTTGAPAYITSMTISGRQATERYPDVGIYYRTQDDSSVTAYEERVLSIQNDYIQDKTWAQSLANLILAQFSDPENMQTITIKAKPHLQVGDLINWQGRNWRIFDIKAVLDPSRGFLQDLKLFQRTVQTYFRIGISTIGGPDKIAA